MTRTGILVTLALAAGCGGGAASAPAPAPHNEPPPAPAGPSAAERDAQFQALAEAVAARLPGDAIESWGTAPIGDDGALHRWAAIIPGDMGADYASYLIEAAPGTAWRVQFMIDGRTRHWGAEATTPLAWTALDTTTIDHHQSHRGGGEDLELAVRGGDLGAADRAVEDLRDGDEPVRTEYAPGNVCATPCPPLATFRSTDAALSVYGPSADPAVLVPEM